ncbi:MAG: hypothetical protein QXG39_07080 [Candidatus Aenigmatarchaeota archaeon]
MSSKGQTLEILEILFLLVGIATVLLIVHFRQVNINESQKELLAREHLYNRVSDAILVFQSSKIYGTEKSLASLLSDAINNEDLTINYGKGYGEINVSKLVSEFFENYFGKNWRFVVYVPRGWVNVSFILDTSGSLSDEVNIIKDKIEEINLIALKKKIKLNIYTLKGRGSSWGCEIFRGTSVEGACSWLSGCQLLEQTEEDWGNGIKCLTEKLNLTALIIITDELSSGSDVCLCTNGNLMGNFTQSFGNALTACKSKNVSVFTLKGNFSAEECANNVRWKEWCKFYYLNFYPQPNQKSCELCGIEKVVESLQKISKECGGKYFDLSLTNPDEAVKEIIKIIPSKPPIIFGHEVPISRKEIYTFQIKIPFSNYEGETISSELIVW